MARIVNRTKTTNLDTPGQRQREGPLLDADLWVRMPSELYERCKQAAWGSDRSLAAWVRYVVRQACEAAEVAVKKKGMKDA